VYVLALPVTGLDLSVKLRRALGQGKIVPAEELVAKFTPYDTSGEGALNREQLAKFLFDHRVGGPWFCQMMSHNVFRTAEQRWSMDVQSIKIVALARIVHYTMARAVKPVKRYVLTPAAVNGLEPLKALDGSDPTVTTDSLMKNEGPARPARRPAPSKGQAPRPRQGAPRQGTPRQGAPRQAPPRGRSGGRAAGRPPPRGRASGRTRPSGRSGPRSGPRRPGKPRS